MALALPALLLAPMLLVSLALVRPDLPVLMMPAPAEAHCSRHSGLKKPASHRPYVSSAQRS